MRNLSRTRRRFKPAPRPEEPPVGDCWDCWDDRRNGVPEHYSYPSFSEVAYCSWEQLLGRP